MWENENVKGKSRNAEIKQMTLLECYGRRKNRRSDGCGGVLTDKSDKKHQRAFKDRGAATRRL